MSNELELIEEALANLQARSPSGKKEEKTRQAIQESSFETSYDANASSITYTPLEFTDAAEFLMFYDPALRLGKKKLYAWQIEELQRLSKRENYSTEYPLEYLLLAANGSGKDAYIIAGFAVFALCCWKRYKIVITSSSDLQLDSQTRNYIKYLSEQVNNEMRAVIPEAIDIKKESFKATIHKTTAGSVSLTGSEIITFVTNLGGRAEGHHPFPDADLGEGVILIANEAKTIPQEIFDHFAKCTYNYFIQVSSAGARQGHFFNSWIKAQEYPAPYLKGKFYGRRITAYDCPHIAKSKLDRELEEFGANDPWFKNTRLSLFSSFGISVVITEEMLDKCVKSAKRYSVGLGRRAGLDLSGRGNDFNTLYVVEENELIAFERWRARDTELTVDLLAGSQDGKDLGLFQKYSLTGDQVTGDDNGIGQGIIDGLGRRGYHIRRVLNQQSAINTQKYLNRGAEMWFTFARIIEAGHFCCSKELMHDILRRQLTNRHYENSNGKQKLWSKSEEKSGAKGKVKNKYGDEGESDSPDDADALILAFSGISVFDFQGVKKEDIKNPQVYPTTQQITRAKAPKYFIEGRKEVKTTGFINALKSIYK
jgi:phage terminase large subunit